MAKKLSTCASRFLILLSYHMNHFIYFTPDYLQVLNFYKVFENGTFTSDLNLKYKSIYTTQFVRDP